MSLTSNVRNFLRSYLKNPLLVAAVTFLIVRTLKKYLKKDTDKESLDASMREVESIRQIKSKGNKFIIYDTQTKHYILTDETGDEIYAHPTLKAVEVKL